MGTVKPDLSRPETVAEGVEAEVRDLVRELNQGDAAPVETSSDIALLKMSANAIAEIDKLMDELQSARNYLHAEGERVRRMTSRYEHLTKTALASVRIISERMNEWRAGGLAVVAAGEGNAAPAPEMPPMPGRALAGTPAE